MTEADGKWLMGSGWTQVVKEAQTAARCYSRRPRGTSGDVSGFA